MSREIRFKVNGSNQKEFLYDLVIMLRNINNRLGGKETQPTYLLIDVNENRADFCEFDNDCRILFPGDEGFKAKINFRTKEK